MRLQDKTIAIIGLGLLGGSIAKTLRARAENMNIIGITRNKNLLTDEEALKVFTTVSTDIADLKEADIIIISTPIKSIISIIAKLKGIAKKGAVITDVGSVKRTIINAATVLPKDVYFVGGHPMAGSHLSGFNHSSSDLFSGVTWAVCPSKNANANDEIVALVEFLGAEPTIISPDAHDKLVSASSHLPHVVAGVLADHILSGDNTGVELFIATGFLDTTRIAASDPVMWEEIINNNKDYIVKSLSGFQKRLNIWQKAIKENDVAQLTALLANAKQVREGVTKKAK